MKFKAIHFFVLFGTVFLFSSLSASAAGSPVVSAFTANPQSVTYGYTTLLSWTINNGAGHDLYFTCPAGVTIKKDDGTAFPCNMRQSVSTNASDNASFLITNATGNSVVLVARVIPKDAAGVSYDAGSLSTNLYVGTVPNPITDFSYATTTATSTTPINLSWTSVAVGGVNLQFDCANGITVYSTSPAVNGPIACGKIAYVSDLNPAGTASIYFVNSAQSDIEQTVRIFPTISVGAYDATHAKTVTFTIPPKPLPIPSAISLFTSSQSLLASNQSITFSWAASNAAGVNFQMPCGNNLTWNNVVASTTTPLLCNVPAFASALRMAGTTTISFINAGSYAQPITITIYPQNFDGTYDGTKSRTVSLIVLEPGHVEVAPAAPVVVPVVVPAPAATSTVGTASGMAGVKVVHTLVFTLSLKLGSKNAQVTALQNLLKQDSKLYPGGLVTGTFGPATLAALKRFQVRYGLAKPREVGYGSLGPKTRSKLNSIQTF